MLDHLVSICVTFDSPLGEPVYDQVPTGLWLRSRLEEEKGSICVYFGHEDLDQRCNVNLIMRRILNQG